MQSVLRNRAVAVLGIATVAAVGLYGAQAPQVANAAPADSSAPSTRATTAYRALAGTAIRTVKVKPGKTKTVRVLGTAGIPATGVASVHLTATATSETRGKVILRGSSMAKVKIKKKLGGSKTFSTAPRSGSVTVTNKTQAKAKVTLAARGYWLNSTGINTAASFVNQPCGRTTAKPGKLDHVVWIILENRKPSTVIGNPNAPYLNWLKDNCGYASNYWAVARPSLPNYIAMTSGGTQGFTGEEPPFKESTNAASVFSQLSSDWRVYAESMPSNCYLDNKLDYVARRNPAAYYKNIRDICKVRDTALPSVLDLTSKLTLIIPNGKHNGHDPGTMPAADAFIKAQMAKILSSAEYQAGRTAVIVTTSDDGSAGASGLNQVPTWVIAPSVGKGTVSNTQFTHYSLLRTTQNALGLPLLGGAKTAPNLGSAFNLQ